MINDKLIYPKKTIKKRYSQLPGYDKLKKQNYLTYVPISHILLCLILYK